MSDHGLIFRAPLVQALLDGRKTQTRRPITRHNGLLDGQTASSWAWRWLLFGEAKADDSGRLHVPHLAHATMHCVVSRFTPGDRVWCRETWCTGLTGPVFRASCQQIDFIRWRSPLHLRKADARIWRRIVCVRAERPIHISRADAIAEGAPVDCEHPADWFLDIWRGIYGGVDDWCWVLELEALEDPDA